MCIMEFGQDAVASDLSIQPKAKGATLSTNVNVVSSTISGVLKPALKKKTNQGGGNFI